jgi:hypothetical protein
MKQIFFTLFIFFSLNCFSQTQSDNQFIKRDCDIIVVTVDSTTTANLRKTPGLIEEIPCFTSATNSVARMFWFDIRFENEVLKGINYCTIKGN